jgi:pimeloyl-ACP methyl ester carboxylesterase
MAEPDEKNLPPLGPSPSGDDSEVWTDDLGEPTLAETAPTDGGTPPFGGKDAARIALAGAFRVGALMARGAKWTADRVADGYRAVDPDLRRHALHAPVLGLTQVLPAREELEPKAPDGFRPALFVHGLAGHPGNFGPMRAYFSFMGRKRTYAVAFTSGELIPQMAEHLERAVERIIEVNELDRDAKINVVAHSMGGLVARYALHNPELARRIGRLVTIGTPHAGTYTARFAATAQTLDLRPGSEVLRVLERQVPWTADAHMPRLTALWSDSDMMLLPHGSAAVEGADNVEMPGFTHLSYLLHPRAFQRVFSALERD